MLNLFYSIKEVVRTPVAALLLGCAVLAAVPGAGLAQVNRPASQEALQHETSSQVRATIEPILRRYCGESCELLDIRVTLEQDLPFIEDLGFEGVSGKTAQLGYTVSKVDVDIQIDERITSSNRERLQRILENHVRAFGLRYEVIWRPVQMPTIGRSSGNEHSFRHRIERDLNREISRIIERFCPEQCLITQIMVDGSLITPDLARDYPSNQILRDEADGTVFRIDDIDVEVAIDNKLEERVRSQVANLIRARSRFVSPININIAVTEFPETYAARQQQLQQELQDPYGLERLRRMLEMFRDLAGTREVIERSSVTTATTSEIEQRLRESLESRDRRLDTTSHQSFMGENSTLENALWIGGALVVAGLLIALFMRVLAANRDARVMMANAEPRLQGAGALPQSFDSASRLNSESSALAASSGSEQDEEVSRLVRKRMRVEELRRELIHLFVESPKVARETFTRLIKEDGIEETSKYIHLLGHLVIFELLDDPSLSRDLYQLSEYFNSAEFSFDLEEEHRLLQVLKTKTTASEIRVLTRKSLDKFDFLGKLDSEQIFNLISEEKPQVQSIVLTQLDRNRRMTVFNMYQGDARMLLMGELCRADAIPKEYLANVAQALARKVQHRPEFDTENLRSSDILLDLMERANLAEQRRLMANLVANNADAARGIKMKLITVEILPYLKDGHLLEIILGLEREDLLSFLMGAPNHVRDTLLAKAPHELADSWVEDLQYLASVDDNQYRKAEMKVLGRVRGLANNGAISLLDINEMIFSNLAADGNEDLHGGQEMLGNANMVA